MRGCAIIDIGESLRNEAKPTEVNTRINDRTPLVIPVHGRIIYFLLIQVHHSGGRYRMKGNQFTK